MDALVVLCAQLTCDLFAIAKFLFSCGVQRNCNISDDSRGALCRVTLS